MANVPGSGDYINANPKTEAQVRAALFAARKQGDSLQGEVDQLQIDVDALEVEVDAIQADYVSAPTPWTTDDQYVVRTMQDPEGGGPRTVARSNITLNELNLAIVEATNALKADPELASADTIIVSNGPGVLVHESTIQIGDVVTADTAFGTDDRIIISDGTGKGVEASSVLITDVSTTITDAVRATNPFGTEDRLLISDGTARNAEASSIAVGDVVTADTAFGTDDLLIVADGTGKAVEASGIAAIDVVTSGSNIGINQLVSGVGVGRQVGNSGITTTTITNALVDIGILQDTSLYDPAESYTAAGFLIATNSSSDLETVETTITASSVSTLLTNAVTAASTFATDNRLVRSDGTGRGAQASAATLDDSGRLLLPFAVGTNCIAVGANTLSANVSGNFEIAIGDNALAALQSGNSNVASGVNALQSLTAGGGNFGLGTASLRFLATGDGNVGIGVSSGVTVTSGSGNTFIGQSTDSSSATTSNSTAIGNGATVTGSNQVVIGNSSVTSTTIRGAVTGYSSFDTAFVFNEPGANVDARFEGDTDPNLFFTDASADAVGIGLNTPLRKLHVQTAGGVSGVLSAAPDSTGVWNQFANTTTGTGSTDGLFVGINASEQAELWNYENTALRIATNNTLRVEIGAGGVITSGSVLQPNYAVYGYGAGTEYELTTSSAEVNRGTTDSAVTLAQAGTYEVGGSVTLHYDSTTFISAEDITVKLRRTNNTATDVANTTRVVQSIITSGSGLFNGTVDVVIPHAAYTTANTNDRLAIFVEISGNPTTGDIFVANDNIFARRVG